MLAHFKDKLLEPYLNQMLDLLLIQITNTKNSILIDLTYTLIKKHHNKMKQLDDKGVNWYNKIIISFTDAIISMLGDLNNKRNIYFKFTNVIEYIYESKNYESETANLELSLN